MLVAYKQAGETPLECASRYGLVSPFTYAGRLDPMAEGLLLFLEGEECKERGAYLSLPKTYEYVMIVGVSTDSYDALGYIDVVDPPVETISLKEQIEHYIGTHLLPYPPYSSKPVNGIPLFKYARAGVLDTIQIPIKEFEIYAHFFINQTTIQGKTLANIAIKRIQKVHGDFRQRESIERWKMFKKMYSNTSFGRVEAIVHCSSGTYVRSIVTAIGQLVGCPTFTHTIKRTAVGNFTQPIHNTFNQIQKNDASR